MQLQYLGANQAWCFTFADSIVDLDGIRSFPTRDAAVTAAAAKGLKVGAKGAVTTVKANKCLFTIRELNEHARLGAVVMDSVSTTRARSFRFKQGQLQLRNNCGLFEDVEQDAVLVVRGSEFLLFRS
jgi:hypothetical protein